MMNMEHIKSLLEFSYTYNFSAISHSFNTKEKDTLTVKCIKDTQIFEVVSRKTKQIDYYTSIDQAAKTLYEQTQIQTVYTP